MIILMRILMIIMMIMRSLVLINEKDDHGIEDDNCLRYTHDDLYDEDHNFDDHYYQDDEYDDDQAGDGNCLDD